ncbi:MAG: hypothetical protein ACO2ZM_09015, partial [Francisellaceae bacterium]
DFFGQPARTMNFPGKLYERYKPAVIVGYCSRNGIAKGYTLHVTDLEPEIEKARQIEGIADPLGYAMNRAFEQLILNAPKQYQWGYKRFKHRQDGGDIYQ